MPIDPLIANLQSPLMGPMTIVAGLPYERTWTSVDNDEDPLPLSGVDDITFRVIDPVSREVIVAGIGSLDLNMSDEMTAFTVALSADNTTAIVDYCGSPRGASDQPQPTRLRGQVTLYDDAGKGYLYMDLSLEFIAWA